MSDPELPLEAVIPQFQQALADCRRLYVESARDCVRKHPQLIRGEPDDFVQMMADLHKGLLTKIYVTITEADWRWCHAERRLAEVLFEHLWGRRLTGRQLEEVATRVADRNTGRRVRFEGVVNVNQDTQFARFPFVEPSREAFEVLF